MGMCGRDRSSRQSHWQRAKVLRQSELGVLRSSKEASALEQTGRGAMSNK